MGDRFQPGQAQESARSFDGVYQAEDISQDIHIAWILFELNHLLVQAFQRFRSLGKKFC